MVFWAQGCGRRVYGLGPRDLGCRFRQGGEPKSCTKSHNPRHMLNSELPKSKTGGCQNQGPFLGTLNNRCRIITGTQIQKRTIILTTTQT